jgi:hypothetical protein
MKQEPGTKPSIDTITRLMLRVYTRQQQGLLTLEQATKEINLLKGILKAVETTALEKRVELVEQWIDEE